METSGLQRPSVRGPETCQPPDMPGSPSNVSPPSGPHGHAHGASGAPCAPAPAPAPAPSPKRVLEFYSGIGGMHYALQQCGHAAAVVRAFDINTVANRTYEHNFGGKVCAKNLETVSAKELASFGCDTFLMAPPCQPYTRQGLQKDVDDPRARSFLHFVDLLGDMGEAAPTYLVVENVVGFEASATRARLLAVLRVMRYAVQEFILTPKQFGVPYQRRRYFLLAKRAPLRFAHAEFNGQLLYAVPMTDMCMGSCEQEMDSTQFEASCSPLQDYLDPTVSSTEYQVPEALLRSSGMAADIVQPGSRSCCCITKAYGRFLQGTGSLLQTGGGRAAPIGPEDLPGLGLRYLAPQEIARLHGFPPEFRFPADVGPRPRYSLLGNSLSATVVAALLRYLYCEGPAPV